MEAEFRFGLLDLSKYHLGDKIRWEDRGRGLRFPKRRPQRDSYTDDAYAVCPICHKDFWLSVTVAGDIITEANVNPSKAGYIA